MQEYLFYDEETDRYFLVWEHSLTAANIIAHKYFKRPFVVLDNRKVSVDRSELRVF